MSQGLGRLVEIAGVAGAGKSTLVRLISQADPSIKVADFIHARNPEHLVYELHSAPRLLPILIRGLVLRPRLNWPDVKLLVYVTEWSRFLTRKYEYRHALTLLDQGPMYALVRLMAKGSRVSASPVFERWWNQMIADWSRRLDAIVWLDAADDVLWERINNRAQPHAAKSGSAVDGQHFITRYRELFDEVFRRIEAEGKPTVIRIDTSKKGSGEVAGEVRRFLDTDSRASGSIPW